MTYPIAQNQGGVLPLTFPFNLPVSGDLTLGFSGSCSASLPGAICGVGVFLDDKHLGDVPLCFNNVRQHLALPTFFFPINLDFGAHTITLHRITDTTITDQTDAFSLWIID
ncbi:hypothetical protein DFR29_12626 [Tahibacter aquaticus]|uniref:Uncharacterized protein n=1 Tax=Tahibacter aquaticus TaxID=520092 RepID=A0A4R6YJG8_9GAMM|nr:hypothetical protein [Tahibacter aquaticus]TDR36990.1 hypothetical protein DFR29_12626 [Tahibacter aquaticus]